MTAEGKLQYLVLPNVANPYLLARVRWPDVCQAISPGRPIWQEDPGLFDLPYDPSGTPVTLEQATTIAAGWGVALDRDDTTYASGATLIRRMPSNWSNLSPAELRAWAIDDVPPRRGTTAPADAADPAAARARAPKTSVLRRLRWPRKPSIPSPQVQGVEALPVAELPTGTAAGGAPALGEQHPPLVVVSGATTEFLGGNGDHPVELAEMADVGENERAGDNGHRAPGLLGVLDIDVSDIVVDLRDMNLNTVPLSDEPDPS